MLRMGSGGASISGFARDGRDSPYLPNMAQATFGFYLQFWRKERSDNLSIQTLGWLPGAGFPRQHRSWRSPGIHLPLGLILLCLFRESVFCPLSWKMLHSCWWWRVSHGPSTSGDGEHAQYLPLPRTSRRQSIFPTRAGLRWDGFPETSSIRAVLATSSSLFLWMPGLICLGF